MSKLLIWGSNWGLGAPTSSVDREWRDEGTPLERAYAFDRDPEIPGLPGGSHLSDPTCLTEAFFKSDELFCKLWRSLTDTIYST